MRSQWYRDRQHRARQPGAARRIPRRLRLDGGGEETVHGRADRGRRRRTPEARAVASGTGVPNSCAAKRNA